MTSFLSHITKTLSIVDDHRNVSNTLRGSCRRHGFLLLPSLSALQFVPVLKPGETLEQEDVGKPLSEKRLSERATTLKMIK